MPILMKCGKKLPKKSINFSMSSFAVNGGCKCALPVYYTFMYGLKMALRFSKVCS